MAREKARVKGGVSVFLPSRAVLSALLHVAVTLFAAAALCAPDTAAPPTCYRRRRGVALGN